jgi:hypothetical protein
VKYVESLGGWAVKLSALHVSGLPDRLVLLPGGRVVFVELKAPGRRPRKIQLKVHDRLRGLGFEVLIINNEKDFLYL